MERVELKAQPREVTGKKVRFLRRRGLAPANLYGRGVPSTPLQVDARSVEKFLAHAGANPMVTLEVDGMDEPIAALIKKVQQDPTTGALLHLDFMKLDLARKMEIEVSIALVGKAAVPESVGQLAQHLHSLKVECLPGDLPPSIEVNISSLAEVGHAIRVGDLPKLSGVDYLNADDELIVRVEALRAAEEEKVEAPVAEAAPAEAAAEGEAEEQEKE